VCIRFGQPMKKKGLVRALHGSHGWSWSSLAGHGDLTGEGGEGRVEGGEGAQLGRWVPWGAWGGAARRSSAPTAPCGFSVSVPCVLIVR
jgi:hypothetical protein